MKTILTYTLLLFFSINSFAQYSYTSEVKAKKFGKTITEKDLKNHLYIYASDEFEGRDTGTEGEDKAIE